MAILARLLIATNEILHRNLPSIDAKASDAVQHDSLRCGSASNVCGSKTYRLWYNALAKLASEGGCCTIAFCFAIDRGYSYVRRRLGPSAKRGRFAAGESVGLANAIYYQHGGAVGNFHTYHTDGHRLCSRYGNTDRDVDIHGDTFAN